jgi:uncharacterized protein YbjT (DUF2867 family)
LALVFISGSTGFMGRSLAAELHGRGHRVRALVRRGSEARAPAGCEVVIGDPLDAATFADRVPPADSFVQLVGTAHPSPSKGAEFRAIDLPSARAGIAAAREAGAAHFIYVSVAHPAPMMRDYIAVRMEAEAAIREAGLNATILRPWYVLGPGRRWPLLLLPVYKALEAIPATRDGARRLGLVTREQMIAALLQAVERPARGVRIVEVAEIRGSTTAPQP